MDTKKCTSCNEVKSLESFHKDSACRMGRKNKCKPCVNKCAGIYRSTNTIQNAVLSIEELHRKTPTIKCSGCKQVLSSEHFYRNNERANGLSPKCAVCTLAANSQWYKDNPDKSRAMSSVYRAKKADLFLEDFTYTQIVERDGAEACAYCHTTEGPFDVDHVFPLNLGGWHTPDNLVLACANHNRSKGAVHPAIYVTREGFTPNRAVLRALAMEHELICPSIKEVAPCA